jgi:tetratricopeptide (TPR) repeat protein
MVMPLDWFKVSDVTAVGVALADHFAQAVSQAEPQGRSDKALQDLLHRTDAEVRAIRLNFFKRAKLANSFKWRLLEQGIEKGVVEDATQALVVQMMTSSGESGAASTALPEEAPKVADPTNNAKRLLAQGNASFARGEYQQAMDQYARVVELKPRDADARNNLGATFYKAERFAEAHEQFRKAVALRPNYPEALCNLGAVLQWEGYFAESEDSLRKALKLRPNYLDARCLLGRTLVLQGRPKDAKGHFEKTLGTSPKEAEALLGMGQVACMEGRFEEAEGWFQRTLELEGNARAPSALAGVAGLRRMTKSDKPWLERAKQMIDDGIPMTEEIALRFAMGKYQDDVGAYSQAFEDYKRANDLSLELSPRYQPDARTHFVDQQIRAYTRDVISNLAPGASDSDRPVFVVGMPRSGTTLTEQIIASHPAARGAGELEFWNVAGRRNAIEHQSAPLAEPQKKKLAEGYLRLLAHYSRDALRVVDKAPANSDHLGMIHSVFPRARIIYMQRNPIDTCLSCYFQPFSQALNFKSSLSDLEHYYRQHHRLVSHWREVLPSDSVLEVPYEELIADQVAWTARILEFIDLPWDDRCLDFHKTDRGVATASTWQVRQKIYDTSVQRWRHYEKFIGPLARLQDLVG